MGLAEELKQSHFQTEATKAVVNVIYTGNWIIQRQQEMFKPFGVTMQQYNVLRILKGQQGKPMTVLAITERMLDRMSNASRLVDKLLEKQLVVEYHVELLLVIIIIYKDKKKRKDITNLLYKELFQIQLCFQILLNCF